MTYEYSVQTVKLGIWNDLEKMASQLQTALNSPDRQVNSESGWELWQTQFHLEGAGLNGFLLIYRRPKP